MPGTPLSNYELHQDRKRAESFGLDPKRYDRRRPRYPQALIQGILSRSPGTCVLDVGCGTGIAARQFQAAGCRVLGVEVDGRMAQQAMEFGVEVDVAPFEAWDPAGRQFDIVIAGQAWHWIDASAGATKATEALRPAGRLAVFWNVFQFPPELTEAISAVYRRVLPNSPFNRGSTSALDSYSGLFTQAAEGMRAAGGFEAPEQWQFEWTWLYSREDWLEQLPTHGNLTQLERPQLAEVLDGVGAAIDAVGGSFTMGYSTVAVTAARTSAL